MGLTSVLALIGGVAMFIFGMKLMGESLENMAGSALERVLEKATSTRFRGLLVGLLVTGIIQSSSATTVMTVGFVNAGIMKLSQVTGIIMGANIVTTVTSWILSLMGIDGSSNVLLLMLKPTNFTPVLAIIGVFMVIMSKSEKKRQLCHIFLGFSVLIFGMDMMADAVAPLADSAVFTDAVDMFGNPLLGVAVGMVFTAIIQSSSAATGVLQALAMSTFIPLSAAMPLIMGMNIGTCGTALISSIGTNKNARRTALIHFYFNVMGAAAYLIVYYLVAAFARPAFFDWNTTPVAVAVINTVFNVVPTLILFPFAGVLEKLAYMTVKPDDSEREQQEKPVLLDERFLAIPAFALEQCQTMTVRMAGLARQNLDIAIGLFGKFDKEQYEILKTNERHIDNFEDQIGTFLVKLSTTSAHDNLNTNKLLHLIGDFERIGDHALNLAESAGELNRKDINLPAKVTKELEVYFAAATKILELSIDAFEKDSLDQAKLVEPLEEVIDHLQAELKKREVKRLRHEKFSADAGFVLSDILTNIERVADHCSNVAVCLIEISENSFETHEYIESVTNKDNLDFKAKYSLFKNQYQLPVN